MAVEYRGGADPGYWIVLPPCEPVFRDLKRAVELHDRRDGNRLLSVTLDFEEIDEGKKAEKCNPPLEYCRKFWAVVHVDEPGHPHPHPDDLTTFELFSSQEQAEEACHRAANLRVRPVVLREKKERES